MKLYHYSFTESILEEGLEPFIKHKDTCLINNLIFEQFYDCFGRDYCVFLNQDKRDLGELIVSVDIDDLNNEFIYVANQDLADDIYRAWYKGNNYAEIVKKYVNSIVKFSDYNNEYKNSEIFYTEYIKPELLMIEYINEEFFKDIED